MAKEEYEARVRIGDLHEERYVIIELKDMENKQYEISKAYPIKKLNNEELVQKFLEELKQLNRLGYVIHY